MVGPSNSKPSKRNYENKNAKSLKVTDNIIFEAIPQFINVAIH
jgi:hypothetical protein